LSGRKYCLGRRGGKLPHADEKRVRTNTRQRQKQALPPSFKRGPNSNTTQKEPYKMNTQTKIILVALIVAAIAVVGGCGGEREEYLNGYEEYAEPAYPLYFRAISAQEGHSSAITSDGRVFQWGRSAETLAGGDWVTTQARSFHTPYIMGIENAVAVFGWRDFSGAVLRDGSVWVWGGNWEERLAPANRAPTRLATLENVAYVQVNAHQLAVMKRDGAAYIRGIESELERLDISGVTQIAAGPNYMLILNEEGYAWEVSAGSSAAVRLPVSNVRAIAAGSLHAVTAVTNDGFVYQWGTDMRFEQRDDGELVQFEDVRSPVRVGYVDDVIAVASGNHFTVAVQSNGTLWGWGMNELGVLGDYQEDGDVPYPRIIAELSDIVEVSASGAHFLALARDGTVWSMGQKFDGLMIREDMPARVRDGIMVGL